MLDQQRTAEICILAHARADMLCDVLMLTPFLDQGTSSLTFSREQSSGLSSKAAIDDADDYVSDYVADKPGQVLSSCLPFGEFTLVLPITQGALSLTGCKCPQE